MAANTSNFSFNTTILHSSSFLLFVTVYIYSGAVLAQVPLHPACRFYEQQLQFIDSTTALQGRQSGRVKQLLHMQQQASSDSRRYRCQRPLSGTSANAEPCRYISQSLEKIDKALSNLVHQAAITQQRRSRQAIYYKMRDYQCRSPQNLHDLLQVNQPSIQRKRIKQQYKQPKSQQQAALQQPNSMPAALEPASPQQPAILAPQSSQANTTPANPLGAPLTNGMPQFAQPADNRQQNAKTAENTPPPVQDVIDYVPDNKIRRVGPAYFPAQ